MVLIDAKVTQDVTMADGPIYKKYARKSSGCTETPPTAAVGGEPGTGPAVRVLEIKPFISAVYSSRA
jgi:hypothetical protein